MFQFAKFFFSKFEKWLGESFQTEKSKSFSCGKSIFGHSFSLCRWVRQNGPRQNSHPHSRGKSASTDLLKRPVSHPTPRKHTPGNDCYSTQGGGRRRRRERSYHVLHDEQWSRPRRLVSSWRGQRHFEHQEGAGPRIVSSLHGAGHCDGYVRNNSVAGHFMRAYHKSSLSPLCIHWFLSHAS